MLYFFLIRKKNYALNNVPFIGEALQVRTFVINPSDVTESDTNDYVHFSGSLPQDSLRLPLGERGLTAFPLNNGMKEHDPNLFFTRLIRREGHLCSRPLSYESKGKGRK